MGEQLSGKDDKGIGGEAVERPLWWVEGDDIGNRYRQWSRGRITGSIDTTRDCWSGIKDKGNCPRIERLILMRAEHMENNPEAARKGIPGPDLALFRVFPLFCQSCIVATQRPPGRWERLRRRQGDFSRPEETEGGQPEASGMPEAVEAEAEPQRMPRTEPIPQDMLLDDATPPAEASPGPNVDGKSGGNMLGSAHPKAPGDQSPGSSVAAGSTNAKTDAGTSSSPAPSGKQDPVAPGATIVEGSAEHSPGNATEVPKEEAQEASAPATLPEGERSSMGAEASALAGDPSTRTCYRHSPPKEIPAGEWDAHQEAHYEVDRDMSANREQARQSRPKDARKKGGKKGR